MRFILLLIMLFANPLLALEGKVVNVHDGDTLTIVDNNEMQHKIRLAQIDAPEIGQSWGKNSKQSLNRLVINKVVRIVVVDTDRYGRTVGTVYLGEVDICREQVSEGNAWVYRRFMSDQSLLKNEQSAQDQGLGLWSESDPVPPWEWRKR